jgi:hypothetical protein
MSHRSRLHALFAFACVLPFSVACGSPSTDTASPRASIAVSPAQTSAEAGAPLDLEYRLSKVADAAPLSGNIWVFVHMLDESGTLLWTDDHQAPAPASWATEPVSYRRTMFVPRIPYSGRVRVEAGLFSKDDGTRVAMAGVDRGGQSYDVAAFEMKPASNAVFVSFGDGWHGAERDAGEAAHEWRWSKGDARLSFRNPRRDAVIWLELDQPVTAVGAQTLEVRTASTLLASIKVVPGARRIERVALPATQLGTAPMVDLDVHVQPTFVPASTAGVANQDTRELGVRVFNVYVQ